MNSYLSPLAGRGRHAKHGGGGGGSTNEDVGRPPSPRPSPPKRGEGGPPRVRLQLIFILEQVLNGLLSGVYYLLIALGLSLIFSLGGIVNLAHGAFYAIGAYLTVVLSRQIGFVATFVAAPVLVGLLGIIIERL